MFRLALLLAVVMLTSSWAARADTAAAGGLLFEQKCAACHTIGQGDRIGPDLRNVAERRAHTWLLRFITAPDEMIAAKDETALRLFEKYNRIAMPNFGLSEADARAVLGHIQTVSAAALPTSAPRTPSTPFSKPDLRAPQSTIFTAFLISSAIVVVVFAWIALSTRSPAEVDVKRAYGWRKVFFSCGVIALVALLAATAPRAPYASVESKPDRIVHVAARQFEFIFADEPITSAADLGRAPTIQHLELQAGELVEFQVTALDVNHGFGLYGPQRQLVAQTQAMPGYVNRLLVRLTEPGEYKVLCLEYCAAGHHLMQTSLTVH